MAIRIRRSETAATECDLRRLLLRLRLVLERGFHLLDDAGECDFIGDREIGEDLAIETDVGGLEAFGETAVGQALRADGGVQALDPEITESALARLAIAISPILGPSWSRLSRNGKVWNGGRGIRARRRLLVLRRSRLAGALVALGMLLYPAGAGLLFQRIVLWL